MWESIGTSVLGGIIGKIVQRKLVEHGLIKAQEKESSILCDAEVKHMAYEIADHGLREIENTAADPAKVLAACAAARAKLKTLLLNG